MPQPGLRTPTPAADAAEPGVPIRIRGRAGRSRRLKSEVTRDRLRSATESLLERTSLRDLKVADIAALACVAPATFYIYFADVNEAVLAVLDEVGKQTPDLEGVVRAMTPNNLPTQSRKLVRLYLAFWNDHYAVLRTRNLRADEGDMRFREARSRMLHGFLYGLSDKIQELRRADLEAADVPAMALAVVVVGAMERLASIVHMSPPQHDTSRPRVVDAAVMMIVDQLTPRRADQPTRSKRPR